MPSAHARTAPAYHGAGRADVAPRTTQYSVQVEEPHERLGPLDDVGDALGLQRVDDPDQRRRQREQRRVAARYLAELRQPDHATNDAEERQAGEQVHREVHQVISPDVEPSHPASS